MECATCDVALSTKQQTTSSTPVHGAPRGQTDIAELGVTAQRQAASVGEGRTREEEQITVRDVILNRFM